jgi:ribose transport system substrate-binding protein
LEDKILKRKALLSSSVLALGLLALLLISACSITEPKYFLVAPNLKAPYWKTAQEGFYAAARELNVKARVAGPDTYDPAGQVEEFQRVVRLKPDGILVSAADAGLLGAQIDAAVAAGIPVITIDSDAPDSKRLMFIGTNNHQVGVMGGEKAVKHMGGKGNVVVFTNGGSSQAERLRGYKEVFARHSGIQITEVVDIKGDPRIAFDKALELVAAKTKVDAFICLEEFSANEVAEVMDRAKLKKTILAMDTNEATLEWIRKGVIAATIAEEPYRMGYDGLKKLAELRAGKSAAPASTQIETRARLVDKDNIEEYTQQADRSPGM